MIELIVVCMAFLIAFVAVAIEQNKAHQKQVDRLMDEHRADLMEWNEERQKLLDRIQASSFAEYKTAEMKLEKIKQNEPEPPKLEPV